VVGSYGAETEKRKGEHEEIAEKRREIRRRWRRGKGEKKEERRGNTQVGNGGI
jgi:hypothetical protein